RVRNNQSDKVQEEQAGEWSGIAEVGAGRVLSMSGVRQRDQEGRQMTGSGSSTWEQYTKALIAGLVLLKYTSCNQPQVMA
ncbi:unnamed protein product, partial [Staurois parvus]